MFIFLPIDGTDCLLDQNFISTIFITVLQCQYTNKDLNAHPSFSTPYNFKTRTHPILQLQLQYGMSAGFEVIRSGEWRMSV